MILELAILNVRPGRAAEFEHAFHQARRIISSMAGYVSHELQRCLEVENKYGCLFDGSGSRIIPKGFASTLNPWMAHD